MQSKVTYHQQVSYCGKPRCRKCREGTGHGPYWYAYKTVDGRTTRTYIGKNLPPDVQAQMEGHTENPAFSEADSQSHASIRIYVLGQFRLERRASRSGDWQTVTESAWQHQRVRALLGSLVSATGRKLGREQIMDNLWPELDLDVAASRLDRAVYSLRQIFEPQRNRPATSPLLLTEREVLALADQSQIWVDADAFDSLLSQAHSLQREDPGKAEKLFNEAATLYGGIFLPEARKVEWTSARRESLQRSWIGMLLELADLRIRREAFQAAIEPLDRLLLVDPTNEAAVQRLIKLLVHLGRRGEALRAYKRLATVLSQGYHIAPLPDTRQLYDELKSGNNSAALALNTTPSTSTADTRTATAHTTNMEANPALRIGRTHQSPLIGRNEELMTLRTMIEHTEQAARFKLTVQKKTITSTLDTPRRPQCGILMGEVGIGKTRLAEELSREARGKNWAVAWSRVYAQETSIPYRLWTEILRKATTQGAWQRQEMTRRPLVFQPLAALLPELIDYLPPMALSTPLPPEQEQLRLWEATRELLVLISESTPLIIALDDLQWSDRSSCELLAYLARRIQGHPIVIVGTCRDNELAQDHPLKALLTDLQREHAVETVNLAPLQQEEISALVSYVPHISQPLVQRISLRAAGNPFFAEELARTIGAQLATTASSNGNGQGHAYTNIENTLSKVNANGEEMLPDTITAVLNLRLDRLTQKCRSLLQKAAVLGGSFEFQIISAMEAHTPGMDEDIVLDLLEEGLRSGMLTEEGSGTRVTYQFWHPLLVSHLYETLSAARRASLHRRAADIFQTMYSGREEEHAATITHHLLLGGAADDRIAHFAEIAARHSYALSAYPDAEKHYKIALQHLPSTTRDQRAQILEYLGECTRLQGKYEEARQLYENALQERSQLSAYLNLSQEEAEIQALLWCEVGVTWYDVGNAVKAQQFYNQCEMVLQKANITTSYVWAYLRYWESRNHWRDGNYDKAREVIQEAINLFKDTSLANAHLTSPDYPTQIQRILQGDPVILGRMHNLLGMIEAASGRSSDGLDHYNRALTIFEQHERIRDIALLSCNIGDVLLRRAEFEDAQSALRTSLNLAERVGETPLISFARGNLGVLDARQGNLHDAENELVQGITTATTSNQMAILSIMQATLSMVQQELGKLHNATQALKQALKLSYSMHITPYIGMTLLALGHLRFTQALTTENDKQTSLRLLKRAQAALTKSLSLDGLEAETRSEAQLLLSVILLQLGDIKHSYEEATQAIADIERYELIWLKGRGQRTLGEIQRYLGNNEDAIHYYEQALNTCRKYEMSLEEGHTLSAYGQILIKLGERNQRETDYQRGLRHLQDALRIFKACGAKKDAHNVEQLLDGERSAL
ncbi:DUF6788 family protein [Ktedonospora formicarum]|uniref:Bacterial transcriptional activator domain-containing protein n=1 Tax=Ktedonospora formicarum TaxID=2778364 RepID=A0A8J3MVE3_9CHLR|nr:DUF6788 family protein [Ktedonospora formicarum]GHO46430.1 hypothetical protein KSX_45930 [Ktedonospora formicarum]